MDLGIAVASGEGVWETARTLVGNFSLLNPLSACLFTNFAL